MIQVKRVQTGVRIEASLLKVLKSIAAYKELGLGDLIEGICLHAIEGKAPFSVATLAKIADLKKVYGLTLSASDSHHLMEVDPPPARTQARGTRRK